MSNAFSSSHERYEGTGSGRFWATTCQAPDLSPEGSRQVLADFTHPNELLGKLHLISQRIDLPVTFPLIEVPRFSYGDRLRWVPHSNATDWGLVIGQFYSYAPHSRYWRWCYLIWLDPCSPSAAWIRADIAWEDDLELLDKEAAQ